MIPKIVKVTTRRQLKEFVRFPNRMYKGSPYYVPTLESGDMDTLDREDKVVSFGVCLPSLSEAMQKCGGKLLPFGFLHLIGAMRKNEVLDALPVNLKTMQECRTAGNVCLTGSTNVPDAIL